MVKTSQFTINSDRVIALNSKNQNKRSITITKHMRWAFTFKFGDWKS